MILLEVYKVRYFTMIDEVQGREVWDGAALNAQDAKDRAARSKSFPSYRYATSQGRGVNWKAVDSGLVLYELRGTDAQGVDRQALPPLFAKSPGEVWRALSEYDAKTLEKCQSLSELYVAEVV